MKIFIWLVLCIFLHGASGDTDVFVMEGDSVTLNTDVMNAQQQKIKWYFNGTRIAEIIGDQSNICTDDLCKEKFRNRLKLDHQTGSLIIMNITITDSGDYQPLIISRKGEKIFNVTVHGVSADEREKMKRKSVKEGKSVTLDTVVTKKPSDVMKWYFNEILITEITGDQSKICTDDQCDERFRDRLKLDLQTGSLTIMNTRITDSGEYKLQIISSRNNIHRRQMSISRIRRFSVTVTGTGLSPAAVAGIFVAVVVLLAAAVVSLIYYRRRRIYRQPTTHSGNDGL